MALSKRMMAVGMPAQQALAANGQVLTGQTATGSTQATAFAISTDITTFTTVAASTGCIVPADAVPGDNIEICNFGANALSVYPPVGGTMHNQSVNTASSVAAGKSATLLCIAALTWYIQVSA
jgi:hypothetical protein